jgi:hypothetical protein
MIASVKHNRCIVDKTRAFVNLNELEFLMCPLSPVGLKDDTQHAWVNKPSRRQPVSVLIQPIMADKKPELHRSRTIRAIRMAVEPISRQEEPDGLTLMEGAKPMKGAKASCQLGLAPPSRPSSRGSNAPRGVLGTPGDDWELLEGSGTSTLIGQRIGQPRAMSPRNVASKRQRGTVKALVAGDKNHKKKELHPGMNCDAPHVLEWRDFVKGTLLEIAAGETKLVESAIAQIEAHAGFTTQHVEAIKEHALHLVMPSEAGRLILKARMQEYKILSDESLDASVITLAVMMSAEKLAVDVLHDLVEQGFSQEQGRMPKTPIEMVQEAVFRFEKKLVLSLGKGRATGGKK